MMRSPIPKEIREQLSEDPYMKECDIANGMCEGKLEWHHAFTYAGKRVNELWSIIPLCHHHHLHEGKIRWVIENRLRDRIKHFHAEKEFRTKYPKSDLLPTLKVENV